MNAPEGRLSLSKRAEKSWQDTGVPAKLLVWVFPIVFTLGMSWVVFNEQPAKVAAQGLAIKDLSSAVISNSHKHDLAAQERSHFKEALIEIKSLLKDIRDDQRTELRRRRKRGN